MMGEVCRGCKKLKELVYTDDFGLRYCAECAELKPKKPETLGLEFLLATIPFGRGDRVECRTGAVTYDGVGTVQEVSFNIEHGGTLVFPAFRVEIDEPANEHSPDEGWYTETCLKKVSKS